MATFTPKCPYCNNSTALRAKTKTYNSVQGITVYCQNCGAMISWAPKPR